MFFVMIIVLGMVIPEFLLKLKKSYYLKHLIFILFQGHNG